MVQAVSNPGNKVMILETKTYKEYHQNGELSYTETIAILAPLFAHLYDRRCVHPDGYEWIRVGINGKWDSNGKQQWVLNYDQKGEILK